MKKNFRKIFESVQVDPITGKYFIIIPEQIVNDLSWYEDTEIEIKLEDDGILICEKKD